jgi:hypothetical protein
MFDAIRGIGRSKVARQRAERTMRRMGDQMGGGAAKVARMLPTTRRQRPNLAVVSAPAVAVAGVIAAAGLLLWDRRRRTEMRRRLEAAAGSVKASIGSPKAKVSPPNRNRTRQPTTAGAPDD